MAIRSRKIKGGASASPTTPLKRKPNSTKVHKPTGEFADVLAAVNKKSSKGTMRTASDTRAEYGRVRTGILVMDLCLGGGWKYSRGCMLYGEKSAGKSTVALISVANALRDNPNSVAIWLDIEGTFDATWARRLGVDLERLHICEPDTGEDAVDLADAFLRTKEVCMIVTDSIAFLTPAREIDMSSEQSHVGIHAKLIGNYIRKVNNGMIRERKRGHHVIVMHLNQFRMKIGVMFGDPRVLPGGKALEFSTSQQMQLSNKEHKAINGEDKGIVLYNEHGILITKDKTGGRLKEGQFKLVRDESEGFDPGYIDQTKYVLTCAKRAGLYTGAGTRHTLDGLGNFKSHADIGKFFYENPEVLYNFNGRILRFFLDKWGLP